jgi:hypothetical protein
MHLTVSTSSEKKNLLEYPTLNMFFFYWLSILNMFRILGLVIYVDKISII